MHVFSLINKALTVIKRNTGKDRCAVFIDTRETGTYVTAARNDSIYATVQWQQHPSERPEGLSDEDLPVHDFLDLEFVRDAAKTSYKEIDEDDALSMYAEDTDALRKVARDVETIDYEPLDNLQPLIGVDTFAPLTKSKGIKKLLNSRSNLQQAYVSGDFICFTSGHWLVQKRIAADAATIPFDILEIMQGWRGKVEWLYASNNETAVRFHGMCAEGGLVTLASTRLAEKGLDISVIQNEFSPESFFRIEADELFRFVTKIGKSFGQEDMVFFEYNEEDGVKFSLVKVRVKPGGEEQFRSKHTEVDYELVGASHIKDGSFQAAWKANYLITCLNAAGELIEFVVPISEDGSGNRPCSLIGEDADALVMPKRL